MSTRAKIYLLVDVICAIIIAGYGVYSLTQGRIFDRGYLLLDIAFPLVLILFSVLIHKCVKPKFVQLLLSILLCVPLLIVFVFLLVFTSADYLTKYNENDLIQAPEMIRENSDFIPNIEEIDDYQEIEYYYFYSNMRLFESDTYVLVSKYDVDEYEKQKAIIEQKYIFETESHTVKHLDEEITCHPYAEIDGFLFRRIKGEEAGIYESYPKKVFIVGTNDETHEVVYIDFYDFDIDYIIYFDSFVKNDCGWRYISARRFKSFDLSNIVEFIKIKMSEI